MFSWLKKAWRAVKSFFSRKKKKKPIEPLISVETISDSASEAVEEERRDQPFSERPASRLILTSAGGGGHIAASRKEEQRAQQEGVNYESIYIIPPKNHNADSWMRLPLGVDVGIYGREAWDQAQSSGNINKQKWLVSNQSGTERLFRREFYGRTLHALIRNLNAGNRLTEIVNTQAQNIGAIVEAVGVLNTNLSSESRHAKFNRKVGRNRFFYGSYYGSLAYTAFPEKLPEECIGHTVRARIIMTDLPNKADHFFGSIKKISEKYLEYCDFEFPRAPGVSVDDFAANCEYYAEKLPNLFEGSPPMPKEGVGMSFTLGPIRDVFLEIAEQRQENGESGPRIQAFPIKCPTEDELSVVRQSFPQAEPESMDGTRKAVVHIPENAHVQTIMLGSQAAEAGTLGYVRAIAELNAKGIPERQGPQYVFVFCGRHAEGQKNSLFAKLKQKLAEDPVYDNIKVVPLAFQDADLIANLYARSDEIFLRSGGMSCMEVESVVSKRAHVYFHSESEGKIKKGRPPQYINEEKLKEGLLFWESGNIEHVEACHPGKTHTTSPIEYFRLKAPQNLFDKKWQNVRSQPRKKTRDQIEVRLELNSDRASVQDKLKAHFRTTRDSKLARSFTSFYLTKLAPEDYLPFVRVLRLMQRKGYDFNLAFMTEDTPGLSASSRVLDFQERKEIYMKLCQYLEYFPDLIVPLRRLKQSYFSEEERVLLSEASGQADRALIHRQPRSQHLESMLTPRTIEVVEQNILHALATGNQTSAKVLIDVRYQEHAFLAQVSQLLDRMPTVLNIDFHFSTMSRDNFEQRKNIFERLYKNYAEGSRRRPQTRKILNDLLEKGFSLSERSVVRRSLLGSKPPRRPKH